MHAMRREEHCVGRRAMEMKGQGGGGEEGLKGKVVEHSEG